MTPYKRIGIFLSISMLWSLIWFSQKHLVRPFYDSIPPLLTLFFGLIPAVGLLIGGYLIRKKTPSIETSIYGLHSNLSLIIFSIPILCLTIIGVDNDFSIQPNLFGLFIGIFTLIYASFEEFHIGNQKVITNQLTLITNFCC